VDRHWWHRIMHEHVAKRLQPILQSLPQVVEPLISEDNWVKANLRLIEELGAEPYLRNLLSVLKGNYPRGS
jgi:hypothetical protein